MLSPFALIHMCLSQLFCSPLCLFHVCFWALTHICGVVANHFPNHAAVLMAFVVYYRCRHLINTTLSVSCVPVFLANADVKPHKLILLIIWAEAAHHSAYKADVVN